MNEESLLMEFKDEGGSKYYKILQKSILVIEGYFFNRKLLANALSFN